jgi:hypothetical protein
MTRLTALRGQALRRFVCRYLEMVVTKTAFRSFGLVWQDPRHEDPC